MRIETLGCVKDTDADTGANIRPEVDISELKPRRQVLHRGFTLKHTAELNLEERKGSDEYSEEMLHK